MSILINMEMPEIDGNRGVKAEIRQLDGKLEFGIMTGGYDCCELWSYYPIQEIQKPHGRLIDADVEIEAIEKWENHPDEYIRNRNKDFINFLKEAPTVIPADKDGET